MLNIGIGRRNNREIKFYINSKRWLSFVLLSKPLILTTMNNCESAQFGRIPLSFVVGA